MNYPNVYLNDLFEKEKKNHPDLMILMRYEAPDRLASIKYRDETGASLTVEMEKFGVAEVFWYKDANCEGKGKGIILQEIEFTQNGNKTDMEIYENPDLIEGTILGKIDKKWFEICAAYAYNRKELGIDCNDCHNLEIGAKALGINLNGFAYQGFNLVDCINIAVEAQKKGIPYNTLLEQKISDAEIKGIDVVKKETRDFCDNKSTNTVERD